MVKEADVDITILEDSAKYLNSKYLKPKKIKMNRLRTSQTWIKKY